MTVMGHRKEFLSTPSARRATQTGRDVFRWWMISIHALREEGDRHCPRPRLVEVISIHALREEGDFWWADVPRICIEFLSTPSARRATHRRPAPGSRGSDFYPRPPRGGRPPRGISCTRRCRFLSTPSARRATTAHTRWFLCIRISIHALREEGDRTCQSQGRRRENFYPRPPRGGRHQACGAARPPGKISIHALREEGDLAYSAAWSALQISIHALREEGDPQLRRPTAHGAISIHALREEGDLF